MAKGGGLYQDLYAHREESNVAIALVSESIDNDIRIGTQFAKNVIWTYFH